MTAPKEKDQFDKKEAQLRFEAAIRGAKIVGHKPMKSLSGKATKTATDKRRAQKKKPEKSKI